MPGFDVFLLLALSALWGGSFIFIRALVPIIGPVAVADARMLVAGIALLLFFAMTGFRPEWRKNARRYLATGLLNSAIPFLLYALAALVLPASMEAVFNSLSPMFGALFAAVWLTERLTPSRVTGLLLGAAGVAVMSGFSGLAFSIPVLFAILACLLAPMCYGLAGVYIRLKASDVKPMGIAGGSQVFGGLALAPLAAVFPPPAASLTSAVGLTVLAFALLCNAAAFLIYFRLIADVGPTRARTVTFLIPIFAMAWASLLLHEAVTWSMILGIAVILSGTYLVVRRPGRTVRRAGAAQAG